MDTDRIDENDGTAEAVAQRCRELETVLRALNRWALTYDSNIPPRASRALARYRTLLSGTVMALHTTLQVYDADVEAALRQLDTD